MVTKWSTYKPRKSPMLSTHTLLCCMRYIGWSICCYKAAEIHIVKFGVFVQGWVDSDTKRRDSGSGLENTFRSWNTLPITCCVSYWITQICTYMLWIWILFCHIIITQFHTTHFTNTVNRWMLAQNITTLGNNQNMTPIVGTWHESLHIGCHWYFWWVFTYWNC